MFVQGAVNLLFPLPKPAQSATWRVTPTGQEPNDSAWANIAVPANATSITVGISAALNQITTTVTVSQDGSTNETVPATYEARVVELQVMYTDGSGPDVFTQDYVVRASEMLTVMVNSFQGYTDALTNAVALPNLAGWSAASADDRRTALISAYNALSRMSYEIYYDRDDVYFRNKASWGLPWQDTIGRLYNYSATDFLNLDLDFVRRICEAQVLEADDRLGGDPAGAERDMGILTKKVAEQEHTFRNGMPFRRAICKRAIIHLGGYLKQTARLVRS